MNIGIPGHTPRWYNWHSGIEGSLGLYGAIIAIYWHHQCYHHLCFRWARHQTLAGDKVCKRHHPDMGPGFKLTMDLIKHRHDRMKEQLGGK